MPDVVLFSGGLDSTYVLLHEAPADAVPLFICYGQRHLRQERRAAAAIAAKVDAELVERTITIPWQDSGLTGSGGSWVVPNRNAILASIGAAEAAARGGENVWIGCCADDAEVFPDCRADFLGALDEALFYSCGVRVRAPLVDLSKADIVRRGRAAGIYEDLVRSWSCYDPRGGVDCGECLACEARARGFRRES